jgi:hypothetical protein
LIEEVFDLAELLSREQYWLDYYQSYNPNIGYNISKKATGIVAGGFLSLNSRRKISHTLYNKWWRIDSVVPLIKAGTAFSLERRTKISCGLKKYWEKRKEEDNGTFLCQTS